MRPADCLHVLDAVRAYALASGLVLAIDPPGVRPPAIGFCTFVMRGVAAASS